ncbi:hypothetical protein BC826DRAFT_742296 [Russula brevipes]|nr:hypothetical protein BC826DRAFT_742296 [Russula brevipes]
MDCTIALYYCTGVWASTFVRLHVRGAFLRIRIRATFALVFHPPPPTNPVIYMIVLPLSKFIQRLIKINERLIHLIFSSRVLREKNPPSPPDLTGKSRFTVADHQVCRTAGEGKSEPRYHHDWTRTTIGALRQDILCCPAPQHSKHPSIPPLRHHKVIESCGQKKNNKISSSPAANPRM